MFQSKWSREHTEILIDSYRKCRCLYDPQHPDYKNITKRLLVYRYLQNVLRKYEMQVSTDEIRKKIKNLRNQLTTHLLKNKKSNTNSPLWCFNNLKFLVKYTVLTHPRLKGFSIDELMDTDEFESENIHDEDGEFDTEKLISFQLENNESQNSNNLNTDIRCIEEKVPTDDVTENSELFLKNKHGITKIQSNELTQTQTSEITNEENIISQKSAQCESRNVQTVSDHSNKQVANHLHIIQKNTFDEFLPETIHNKLRSGKEEIFSNFLCNELKKIKSDEVFENLQRDILFLVRKAVADQNAYMMEKFSGS